MKTQLHRQRQRGSALVTILILGTISLIAAGSLLAWTTTNSNLTSRNNEYYNAVAAAEAATEKIIGKIAYDYREGGEAVNQANLPTYRQMTPVAAEDAIMGNFAFTDGQSSSASKSYVAWLPPSGFKVLNSRFSGLQGYTTSFRVVSNARDKKGRWGITGGVRQDVDVTTIPLFQFAIFYNLDLEIHPGQAMTVTGPVHGNYDIYLKPGADLTFEGTVTAAGSLIYGKRPGDCESRTSNPIIDFAIPPSDTGNQLNMPVGTNGTAANVRQIVEQPPAGESALSAMGQQRFFNKADMIIELTGSTLGPTVKVKSGLVDNFATVIPPGQWNNKFVSYGNSFYNKRESKTVKVVDIDVKALKKWSETNITLRPKIGGDVSIIYVDDRRTPGATEQLGVRVFNGEELPTEGLTIATRDPIYVKGDFNNKVGAGISTGHNTTYTRPAALIGDAITILSKNWNDSGSLLALLGSRDAANTTVNAAFMAGINQSASCNYSGGVENFPRFLEDWSGITFTYNGSMVVMYESQIAKGLWLGTGATIGIYNPPIRDWAFDQNFKNPAKLPPGTPSARTTYRTAYAVLKPNTTPP
ncbi:MAG TPA: hypothetical protein VK530_05720 [Candidatus Acidoferrum sp.]|nr:hypothetical protein [Candidatus Acidoferrum sp.]